ARDRGGYVAPAGGSEDAEGGVMGMLIDRFMAKAEPVPESGCWLWTGAVQCTGHGRFGTRDGTVQYAHRPAWRLHVGDIPAGHYVCHKCDTPLCVNPAHLFIGTATDNMRDASRKGRIVIPSRSFASDDSHQPAKLTNAQVRHIRASDTPAARLAA